MQIFQQQIFIYFELNFEYYQLLSEVIFFISSAVQCFHGILPPPNISDRGSLMTLGWLQVGAGGWGPLAEYK